MTPEASVVIPTFNRRAMVLEAAGSVLAQRGADFELIVVDDGSTDGTAEALDSLRRESAVPFAIERVPNRGPAAARNRGVALARASLVAFLDSDDLWMPSKLAEQIAFMNMHQEYAISQCEEAWIRRGRRVNPGRRHRKRGGDFFIDSLRTCLISPSAVIMRTALFRGIGGFDESMAAAEDYDLWLRILVNHDVGLLERPLVTRRAGHADQLSATVPALDRFRILALVKVLGDSRVIGARRQAAVSVLAEKCAVYARGLTRRGREDQAEYFRALAVRAVADWSQGPGSDMPATLAATQRMIARADAEASAQFAESDA
jgi:glycosyltransferase involved in cell wall biosynthesis